MIGRITKVKIAKDKVEIHWEDKRAKTEQDTVYRGTERPHPDLYLVFVTLAAHARRALSLPLEVWDKLAVTGATFSFSEETKIEGAVITAQVTLDNFSAPLILNTPHATLAELEPALVAELDNLRTEAAAYVDGKRAQLELAV